MPAVTAEAVATVGTFDGVHRGHRFLVERVMEEAHRRQSLSMVVTFDRPPSSLFGREKPRLTTLDDKLRLLQPTGIDIVVVLQFDQTMARLSAYQFMELLRDKFHVSCMIIGFNNRFGRRSDIPETLFDYVGYGRQLGVDVMEAPPYGALPSDGLSSSLIRNHLLAGHIAEANRLLGYPYTLRGTIAHGYHVGTLLGFPTANLIVDAHRLVPMAGVYAVRCRLSDADTTINGMMNIGTRPTFGTHEQTLEVNLFAALGDLYGQHLEVSFVDRLRAEQTFSSPEALAHQLALDKEESLKKLRSTHTQPPSEGCGN